MTEAYELLRAVQLGVFAVLALAAVAQLLRRPGRPTAWLAATFGGLGIAAAVARVLPEDSDAESVEIVLKALVVLIVLFPYFLYAFTRTFGAPRGVWARAVHVIVVSLTAALVVGVFLLPSVPRGDEPRSSAFSAYVIVLMVQWAALLGLVAARLWRGGTDQPPVARARMRLLSLGAVGMAMALLVSGTMPAGTDVTWVDLAVQLLGIASGPLFLLGFAPPGFVRTLWRQRSLAQMRDAELELMEATTTGDIARVVLPNVSELMGGKGAVMVSASGDLVRAHGLSAAEADELRARIDEPAADASGVLVVTLPHASVAVEASPFTPFFGPEETDILSRFAVLAELAVARAELLERERHALEQLLEAQAISHLGSWEWDLATNELWWSDELYRIAGRQPAPGPVQYDDAIATVHPDDRAVVDAEVERARTTGEPFSFEYRISRTDGAPRTVHARGGLRRGNGSAPTRMLGTVQDITERKVEEEAREQFIANAAHELRTPLTTILGFVQVLESRRDGLPKEQADAVFAAANRAGERLRSLVDNMLNLTRLQQGRVTLELEAVSVEALLEDVTALAPPPTGKEVDVRCRHGLMARGNRDRLEQILVNLLTNAYRYGGTRIALGASQDRDRVEIWVADDGTGVDEELVPHLFEPFTRGATSSDVGGSGLGLAIAKRLAQANGGDLRYEGNREAGARFIVELEVAS